MSIAYLKRPGKPDLAYRLSAARADGQNLPGVLFCGGFRSDMEGTKASYLEQQCRARGQAYIRFDYSGHGSSGGAFTDGTIGSWAEDARAVMDLLPQDKIIIAGSSMGGWIALLLARDMSEKIAGIVGIAAAPDFTKTIEGQLSPAQAQIMQERGSIEIDNDYSDEPYIFTRALIEDGARYCLLDAPLEISAPVRLVQGMKDDDVPWQTAARIKNTLTRPGNAEIFLIESGDHRLSRPEDLALIDGQIAELNGAR